MEFFLGLLAGLFLKKNTTGTVTNQQSTAAIQALPSMQTNSDALNYLAQLKPEQIQAVGTVAETVISGIGSGLEYVASGIAGLFGGDRKSVV